MTLPIGSIDPDDFELLSLYVDDKLGASARHALEARLAAEPALQAELDALNVTVQVLRSAPQLQIPRNFTLDPAKYQRRFRLGSYLLLPLGALGTFAAVVLIALGIFLTPTPSVSSNAIALKPTTAAKLQAAVFATSSPTTSTLTATASQTLRQLTAAATVAEISPAPAFAFAPTSAAPRPLTAAMQSPQTGPNAASGGSGITNDAASANSPTTDQTTTALDYATSAALQQADQQNTLAAVVPFTATSVPTQVEAPSAQPTAVAEVSTPAAKSAPANKPSSPAISTGQGLLIAGIAMLVLSGILLMVAFMRNFTRNLTRPRP